MTPEHKQAILEALEIYISIASQIKPDKHIKLLEEVVEELESEIPPQADIQDLFDDTI